MAPSGNQQDQVQITGQQRPQVTFDRTGDPKVVYQRAQGQPKVRYETTDVNDQAQNAGEGRAVANSDQGRLHCKWHGAVVGL